MFFQVECILSKKSLLHLMIQPLKPLHFYLYLSAKVLMIVILMMWWWLNEWIDLFAKNLQIKLLKMLVEKVGCDDDVMVKIYEGSWAARDGFCARQIGLIGSSFVNMMNAIKPNYLSWLDSV